MKIATLNLCLGLPNKKEIIKQTIIKEKIDVLCLQETEVEINLDHNLLSFPGYRYESENNSVCSRVGIYVKTNVSYVRRKDLEGVNSHITIIDLKSKNDYRIINLYRSFNPRNDYTPLELFKYQVNIIKNCLTDRTIVLGDFNLDWNKRGCMNYPFRNYFNHWNDEMSGALAIQIVDFPTWSRTVNGILRESVIDHIYVQDPSAISELKGTKLIFGDHQMITFNINSDSTKDVYQIRRSWLNYSKGMLCDMLSNEDWSEMSDTVQGTWDIIENKLIKIVDIIAPEMAFKNETSCKPSITETIRKKKNLRKNLPSKYKITKDDETRSTMKMLDKDIKRFYHETKKNNVRRQIKPGNTETLWKAVKAARDVNISTMPNNLHLNGIPIPDENVADTFARYFDDKIKKIGQETKIDDGVYNGIKCVESYNKMFMDPESIKECMLTLKQKNSEGLDRIPQRVLLDGIEHLVAPLATLFEQIYTQRSIPQQWLVAKTIPIFKNKGDIHDVTNYRPIANLCSVSKIFEKLILKRILDIQSENNVDITRQGQHGFKKNRSTSTLSVELQSIIASALDNDEYVVVSSLDLSSAFDVVNIGLLLKRMKIMGLPEDLVQLVKVWLEDRSYYVNVNGQNSYLFDLLLGTVQGSVLGPVLYAIFVSPLFDIEPVLSFADDSYDIQTHKNKDQLKKLVERALNNIMKWLTDSGLKINEDKTDLCLFFKNDTSPIVIQIGNAQVKTKTEINVLGVTFDSRMNWSRHVSKAITKANKALLAIKLIRKFFNVNELLLLITSNYYSILYYNSEVWHLDSLQHQLKSQLMSASANALRVGLHYPDPFISFYNLHQIANRATPKMVCIYKLSLQLFKTFNQKLPEQEWTKLNFNVITMSRQVNFKTVKTNRLKTGLNTLNNRFYALNDLIPLDWLNKSFQSYKILCKNKFLSFS